MKRPLVAAALVLALLGSSCAALLDLLRSSFKQPTLVYKSVALDDISLAGLTLDTVWRLENPNAVGISLASVDYALFIENKQVVAGAPKNGLTIPPNGGIDLHFPANFRFQDVAGVVETFLTKDTAAWRAEGKLGVQTPIGVLQLPIQTQGSFEVPKVPQVALGNPRVSNLSFNGATIDFPLTVTNRNSFPLPVGGLEGQFAIAGAPVGTVNTGDLGKLDGRGARQLSLPLNVNLFNAASAVQRAIAGGNQQVQFNAAFNVAGQRVPIRVDQVVNFLR